MSSTAYETITVNYPEWTEYRKKNGLDPLGMQNSSVSLYQKFLPGLSNVTLRIRYYGFFAWLSRNYTKNLGSTNPEDWKRYVRRAEALYALIAYRRSGETGVAGIEWAQRKLDELNGDTVAFGPDAEPGSETYYLKQKWGIYGLAYRSQLFEIGILTSGSGHEIPLPSAELGDGLADAFESAVGELAGVFIKALDRGTVTTDELDRLAVFAPSEIAAQSDERSAYQNILLQASDDSAGTDLSRRMSIVLILKIAALLGREPNAEEIRWVLYSGFDQEGNPLVLDTAELEAHRQRWWVYHANDLCHIAFETLLKFVLDHLARFPAGRPLAALIPDCVENILSEAQTLPPSWSGFLDDLKPAQNAYAADDPLSEFSSSVSIMKSAGGRRDERECSPEIAWTALRMLAVLHKRVRNENRDIARELRIFDPDAFRSLLSELRFLDQHFENDFRETVGRLLEERIIRRHLWIALRKFRYQGDYTFLIETDEGKLRLREKDGPVYTNPRLGPAITFLKDIDLIGSDGLTERGKEAAGLI